jgi:hypothetical protein
MTWWKECTPKLSTGFLLPIPRFLRQVLGITLRIMFTINNNHIASNMLIAIVFDAISLSMMENILHTQICKLLLNAGSCNDISMNKCALDSKKCELRKTSRFEGKWRELVQLMWMLPWISIPKRNNCMNSV